jgi:branched-chain amino acid aminotransferase
MLTFDIRLSDDPVPAEERAALLKEPGFGTVFTDHMVTMRWSAGQGWHDGRLEPYGPFTLDPASTVFHYGQEFFEGMKAYRQQDGSIAMFRPEINAARFNRSAQRLAMPELPEAVFVEALELLIGYDRGWVPTGEGNSLYLRPFMIATQRGLGFTHPSVSYLFCIIASPATAYFGGGPPRPLTVWLSEEFSRAAPGGTGFAKAGGNYAGAFAASRQATDHGCDQVVWLDSAHHNWIEEMGGMNIFFIYGRGAEARVVTPPLTGTLLPGVTRDSLLRLARRRGLLTDQKPISVEQWRRDCASGELTEAFACGTAAVIAPIGHVRGRSGGWPVGDGAPGPLTLELRDELLGIQHGRRDDTLGWMHKVC